MSNDTIMLIGGLVIGLIVVVSAVACYFVIKKQKSVNADYSKSSVAERKILENDAYDYSEVISTREFTAMITRFPGFASGKQKVYPGDVILTKKWIKMYNVNSTQRTYVKNNAFTFITRQVVFDDTTYTKADVAKRAAAGAVIAGAAGAVVGAISAAETNKKGGVAHHTLSDTDRFRVSFMAVVPSTGGVPEKQYVTCDGILLSNNLMQKLKQSPEVLECIPEVNGNYIRLPGVVNNVATSQQATKIAEWLNANLFN